MAGRVLLVSAIAMVTMCHYVSAVFLRPPHPLLMPGLAGLSPFPAIFPAFSPRPFGLPPSLLLAQQRSALRRRSRSRSRSSSSSSSRTNRFVSRTGATGPIPLAGGLILDSQTAFQMASPRIINVVVPQEPLVVEALPEIAPAVATSFGGDISDATITIKSSDPASAISSIKSNVRGSISDTEFIIDATGSGGDQSSGQQVVQTFGTLPPSAVSIPATAVAFGGAGGATVGAGSRGAPLQGFQSFGSGTGALGGNFVQSSGSQTFHQSSSSSDSASESAASSLDDIRSSQAAAARQGLNLVPLGAGPVPFPAGPVPIGGGMGGPVLGR